MRRSITALLLGVTALASTFAMGQQAIAKPYKPTGHQLVTNDVYVRTGSRAAAGTNAPVWLWVKGTREAIGPVLLPSAGRLMTRSRYDHYQVDSLVRMSRVSQVCLFRRDGGVSPNWFVDRVDINGISTRFGTWLPQGRWVCVNH